MGDDPFELIERRMARMERRMQEIFEEAFHPSWDLAEKTLEPLYHVQDLVDEVVVTVDLPCVHDKEDLEVSCSETELEIKARMYRPVSFGRWGTVQRDVDFESYRKVIPLPAEVDPEKVRASFKGGILKMNLPKPVRRYRVRIP